MPDRGRSGATTPEIFSQPIGVVIVDEGVAQAEVRRSLGYALPRRIVSWQDQLYLAAIAAVRLRVIVVWGAEEELV